MDDQTKERAVDEKQEWAGRIAGEIARHYRENYANSGVYEIVYEGFPEGDRAIGWRFVGDAADARFRCLVGQPGYIQVSSSRGDLIAGQIAR